MRTICRNDIKIAAYHKGKDAQVNDHTVLQECVAEWQNLTGISDRVVTWIREGITIPFITEPDNCFYTNLIIVF